MKEFKKPRSTTETLDMLLESMIAMSGNPDMINGTHGTLAALRVIQEAMGSVCFDNLEDAAIKRLTDMSTTVIPGDNHKHLPGLKKEWLRKLAECAILSQILLRSSRPKIVSASILIYARVIEGTLEGLQYYITKERAFYRQQAVEAISRGPTGTV